MVTSSKVPTSDFKRNLPSNICILLIGCFYLFNLSNGHDWGGDFSMYIHHAKNIATGVPYAQTGYIYNPDAAQYGPQAYPPVFPLLLTPIILIWGINLLALKIPGILCFLLFLFFLNNWIINSLPAFFRILLLVMIGFSPPFFLQAEMILSDIPFLLFTYIALYRFDMMFSCEEQGTFQVKSGLLTGLFVYLSYGTRTIGIILIPILLVLFLVQPKKNWRPILTVLGSSISLIIMQKILIPGTGSYLDQFDGFISRTMSYVVILFNYYLTLLTELFPVKSELWQRIVFLFTFLLFIAGLFLRLRKRLSGFDIFFAVYFVSILIWPSIQKYRFLLPIIPIYFFIMVEGFSNLIDRFCRVSYVKNAILLACLCLIGFSYSYEYRNIFPRPISAMELPSTQELFSYINHQTRPDDVIVFFKPRVLALFTDRKSMALAIPGIEMDPILRMKENRVSWIVVRKNYDQEYQAEQLQMISCNPELFLPKFENDDFLVYQFRPTD